jgi:hypothetical protein
MPVTNIKYNFDVSMDKFFHTILKIYNSDWDTLNLNDSND